MNCPRCEGTLVTYQLGDRESYVCDACEYVGIAVEHGAEPEELESWDEAMERFYDRFSAVGDGSTDRDAVDDEGADGEEPDDELTPAIVRVDADAGSL